MSNLNKILAFLAFIAALFYCSIVIYRISPLSGGINKKYNIPIFDSRSNEPFLATPQTIKTNKDYSVNEFKINFRFKIYRINGHDNLFQTAPGNLGIRMELANPSTLALIVGVSTGVRGLIVSDEIETNKWYSIVVKTNRLNRVSVLLDDQLVVDEIISFFQHDISDFVIGAGFSKTRMFDGKISDCNIELNMCSGRLQKNLIFIKDILGKIFILLLLILIGMKLLRESALLFHFFICSFGLLKITPKLSAKIFNYNLFHSKAIVFNDWALRFVFVEKPKDLFAYALSAFLLFVYYGLFFILVHVCNPQSEKRFNLFFTQNNIRLLSYFFVISALNVLIIKSDKIYHGHHLLTFQCIMWILFFLAPLIIPYITETKQK